ncbi:MAG: cytochrome c oxidase subunit 3 [Solirubrobacteraceae bacterium]|jgi:heme/copper-type cytochrome/quinol oxidase subunit 3
MSASSPDSAPLSAGLSIHADPGAARADDVRQLRGNLGVGVRLVSGGTGFVFMSFLFAFFYLRAVNSNGLWRPRHVTPVQSWGIVVLVATILCAVVFDSARRHVVAGTEPAWRRGSLLALALGILVVVAQGLEYATITFRTADGGWASVFWGWTLVQLVFWLGAVYWIETLVAQSLRQLPASARLGTGGSELLAPSASACQVYLYTMTAIAFVSYVLLYLVK